MSVWLVHDYLTQRGGAERVALTLTRAFPDAPLTTSFYEPQSTFPGFRSVDVRTLPIDHVGFLRRNSRAALPVLAPSFALRRIDADAVVCSSSGWAHLVRTEGRKIVYCHSPAKWLYRADDYLGARPALHARLALTALSAPLRRFDRWGAGSADVYVANSSFVAEQVEAVYGVRPRVLHPPAGLGTASESTPLAGVEPGFFLNVGRLLPYKHVAEVAEAFRRLPERLVVVGAGPLEARLRAVAPPNVTLLTEVDDAQLRWLYENCAGLVAASREDFGLTPVEAAGFGKPVAALRFGGYLDTVREGTTGVFFDRPTAEAVRDAVEELGRGSWDGDAIRTHGEAFAEDRFVEEIRRIVAEAAG